MGFSDNPQLEKILYGCVNLLSPDTGWQHSNHLDFFIRIPCPHTHVLFFLPISPLLTSALPPALPQLLGGNLRGPYKTISSTGCHQLKGPLALGSTECVLLAVMAFDRLCCCLFGHSIMPQLCTHDFASLWWWNGMVEWSGQHPNSEHHHPSAAPLWELQDLPLHL